jgi:hypothetical protein
VPGHATPGELERRAMVRRGADERQPERDVHAGPEGGQLERDEALVMIGADDRVEGLLDHGAIKESVRGPGRERDLFPGQHRDGGRDQTLVLVAEKAVFTAMRIDAGHGEARLPDPGIDEKLADRSGDLHNALGCETAERLPDRTVIGAKGDGEFRVGQGHDGRFIGQAAGAGEKLGLADKIGLELRQRLLANRRGNHGRETAFQTTARGKVERRECGLRGSGGATAELNAPAGFHSDDFVAEALRQAPVLQGFADDLGTNPGRIAQGQGDEGRGFYSSHGRSDVKVSRRKLEAQR